MKRNAGRLILILLILCLMSCAAGAAEVLTPYNGMEKRFERLELTMFTDSLWEFAGENMRSEVYWDELNLSESMEARYPALADALIAMNDKQRTDMEALSAELTELAEEIGEGSDWITYLYGYFDYFVQRADSTVLSIRSDCSVYWGGAHGEYGTAGINLNPATGEEITLSDVIADKDALIKLLSQRIDEIHPEVYSKDILNTLKDFSEEEFEWTLGYDGICFYFNPYVILDYAHGRTNVLITYDEAMGLINPEYWPHITGGSYVVKVPWFEGIPFDLDPSNDRLDSLMLTSQMDEYDAYERIGISVNGETYEEDIYAYEMDAYLVVNRAGIGQQCYLYLETVSENDYTTLKIYDLNGDAPAKVGELEATGLAGGWYYESEVFTDPAEFDLDTRLEILGTRTGLRTYTISEYNGMPMPQTDYYEISDRGYPMTSLIDLKVTMLDTNSEETIPAGTAVYEIRTDGETYMDFRLDDGRECRIEVDTSGYPGTINGISEYECFDEIMYAG